MAFDDRDVIDVYFRVYFVRLSKVFGVYYENLFYVRFAFVV